VPKYRITETCVYDVEAEDEAHAEHILLNVTDTTEFLVEVSSREIYNREYDEEE